MAGLPRKEFTAKVVGHTLREVTCESCQGEYVYILRCEGLGTGSSVLFLDNKGAEERAAKAAQEALATQLEKAVDGVPCPKCGWYQANMVKHLRDTWGEWLGIVGLIAIVLGSIGLFFCAILGCGAWASPNGPGKGPTLPQIGVAALISGLVVAVGLTLIFVRSRLAAGIEPNDAPLNERLALGRSRAALAGECTEERMGELLAAAGVGGEAGA